MTLPHESPWAQRWLDRRHSWRLRRDGGFRAADYSVARLGAPAARAFITQHHYSASVPPMVEQWGLYDGVLLVGALVLSNPVKVEVLSNPFPDLVPYSESTELGRLVLLPHVPANAESFFVAEALRQATALGFRGVVMHSDPVARYLADGTLVKPGHFGTVYQAGNAIAAGMTRARDLYMLPDATVLSDRTRQKIASHERGWDAAEQTLVSKYGATARATGVPPRAWLRQVLPSVTSTFKHPGNYRYLMVLGTPAERRALRKRIPLARLLGEDPTTRPRHGWYPKADDARQIA